jgi:hypothetical protein
MGVMCFSKTLQLRKHVFVDAGNKDMAVTVTVPRSYIESSGTVRAIWSEVSNTW